ncbi:putative hydrolase of alpha/beta superfamily [Terriglobus roseus DSM 18391]|uniref:Putative hydrolase of alpha/beta superfamily n=1 Tax=Terriglobus roseus (strain DSM 18391 / NRRL B-41598 / KBS 63) TaxID=926566 RepID=I3ZHI2_TERRK|nr:alpha/beta hydrolase-fold protein [Terriglobus roseus]AFL88357.1 putative hydrolase of alpha/beta superfamily [Terriglobus roseus DSM 18391]AFL88700.1 putative hydrolase of alpha/beta superfamily [Terriglobus roseus DSM 18391]
MEIVASQPDTHTEITPPGPRMAEVAAQGRYLRICDWESQYLPNPRDLFLYLPEAYLLEPERSFPVLVLHDGQNLFDGDLAYVKGSTWRAGTTADEEIAAGRVEPLILVGVANTGATRMADYTPTPDPRLGGGRGPFYAQLLIEELLPMLRAEYRVLSGADHTGIAGSSLGGLISLAIGLKSPNVFGRIGVLSPSIWWDNRSILRDVRSLKSRLPLRIWLDMGTGEGLRHVRDADLLSQLLLGKGWREGNDLLYRKFPGAIHNEDAWADRFAEVLQFLFPDMGNRR